MVISPVAKTAHNEALHRTAHCYRTVMAGEYNVKRLLPVLLLPYAKVFECRVMAVVAQ
jgi:hypothetical protein